ncbi:hypothetical protein EDD85DRAFT_642653 [Armillaria nabsnona]|nr:hypothetical protein EDD85DRAFT_642653 [Armillaria nabsnona]
MQLSDQWRSFYAVACCLLHSATWTLGRSLNYEQLYRRLLAIRHKVTGRNLKILGVLERLCSAVVLAILRKNEQTHEGFARNSFLVSFLGADFFLHREFAAP